MAKHRCVRLPIRSAFGMEDRAAVYAIWSLAGICLYVGKTKHLKTRLIQHMRRSHNEQLQLWIDVFGIVDTFYCYRLVEDESTLSRTEARFIKLLNPKTNIA